MLKKLIIFMVLLCATLPVLAQSVDTAWVRKYDGPGGDKDEALSIALDKAGNIHVTGYGAGIGTSWDFETIKYYSNGDTAWVRRYTYPIENWDMAYDIAVDTAGTVYVTGLSYTNSTSSDYATAKYDKNGNEVWVQRYYGVGQGYRWDEAHAVGVDLFGNSYVTGMSAGVTTSSDIATVKYDVAGNWIWMMRYNGSGNSGDAGSDLVVDRHGNIYVTGQTYTSQMDGNSDYVTIKYYPNGDTAWVRTYDDPTHNYDLALVMAVDRFCNVYVAGNSGWDFGTVKYDSLGNELWAARYNGPGNNVDVVRAIAVDDSGNVFVTGESFDSITQNDYATVKYDRDGNELWVRRYTGVGNGKDFSYGLAADVHGNAYVTGASTSIDSSSDIATIKYLQNGDIGWVNRYSHGGARAIAVHCSGNVYVTGTSDGAMATIKYVQFLRGDIDDNGHVAVSDVIYLVNYLFRGGPPLHKIETGDVNCDCQLNATDVIQLIKYLFKNGPPPNC